MLCGERLEVMAAVANIVRIRLFLMHAWEAGPLEGKPNIGPWFPTGLPTGGGRPARPAPFPRCHYAMTNASVDTHHDSKYAFSCEKPAERRCLSVPRLEPLEGLSGREFFAAKLSQSRKPVKIRTRERKPPYSRKFLPTQTGRELQKLIRTDSTSGPGSLPRFRRWHTSGLSGPGKSGRGRRPV